MTIEPGTSLSHYRLVEKIGEGGMGVVWKAIDTTLDREVAVKILPGDVVAQPDTLARFDREAKLLASLNHPNIATVHGFQEAGGVRFLVMELVPGDDLADELKRGPLPLREAMEVALSIARAIEAAHGQGVVHRDLKPANVKRAGGHQVKVLDFGLAKALRPDPTSGEPSVSLSPTVTSAGSIAGVVLGTVAYMSPEQARGRPIDKRTDVWSFGVLFYELLTGSNPFRGDTVADCVGAIMHKDPDLDALPPETPASVRRLLRRCLARKRAQRLSRDEPPAPEKTRRFKLAPDVEVSSPVISPDGTRLAYIVKNKVLIRSLDSLEPREAAIEIGQGADIFWSPDGRSLGVIKQPNELLRFDLGGGAPVTLTDAAEFVSHATWADDGHIYYAQFQGGITRVPENGGVPETLPKHHENILDFHGLVVLPQGRGLLTIPHLEDDDARAIFLERPGEEPRQLYASDSTLRALRYSTTGHLLFHREENPRGLWALPFSVDEAATTGDPFLVVPDLVSASVSSTGDLAFAQSELQSGKKKRQLVWVDRTGREVERLELALYEAYNARVSPDGSKVALIATGIGRPSADAPGIWVIDLERETGTRLTNDRILASSPVWNADGTRVAYIEAGSTADGGKNVVSVRADGTGDRQLLFTTDLQFFVELNRDWSTAIYMRGSLSDENGMGLATLRLDDPSSVATFVDSPGQDVAPQIHPDGDWVVYLSGDIPNLDVVVRPFPEGSGQWKVSRGTMGFATWSDDGTKLYYADGRPGDRAQTMMEVSFDGSGSTPVFGTPTRLFDSEAEPFPTPGGRFVLVEDETPEEGEEALDVNGIVLVENWVTRFLESKS